MPNYVKHVVSITSENDATIKKVKNILTDPEGNFTFQGIIPRPKSLEIEASTYTEEGVAYHRADKEKQAEMLEKWKKHWNDDVVERIIRLGEIGIENIEKYGYATWYDWSIDNWGTKWDACDTNVFTYDNYIGIEFQTAWSTPYPVFEKLAKEFPDIEIEVKYADEDLGTNCGIYAFKNGVESYRTEMGADFAQDLWGYDDDCLFPDEEEY